MEKIYDYPVSYTNGDDVKNFYVTLTAIISYPETG